MGWMLTMISACQNTDITLLIREDRKCSVSAHVVERVQFALPVLEDEKRVRRHLELRVVTDIDETVLVRDLHPFLGEYCSSF
jgi:hypothetical protein